MTPGLYERKAFLVQAAQVNADNLSEIAEWCGGEVIDTPTPFRRNGRTLCVSVPISIPPSMQFNERHGLALIDDWVVLGQFGAKGGEGFKVYQPRAFEAGFSKVIKDEEEAHELKALFDQIEPACGRREQTLDHEPCVLGAGHIKGPRSIGCRSFQDYKLA